MFYQHLLYLKKCTLLLIPPFITVCVLVEMLIIVNDLLHIYLIIQMKQDVNRPFWAEL